MMDPDLEVPNRRAAHASRRSIDIVTGLQHYTRSLVESSIDALFVVASYEAERHASPHWSGHFDARHDRTEEI